MTDEPQQKPLDDEAAQKVESILQAFEDDCVLVRLDRMLPNKPWRAAIKTSKKYKQIAASIEAVGLVEPPVLSRDPLNPGSYFILDGHLRIEILKDLGREEVECLIATDDEAFTYNKQVSRLAAVQEHAMIVNALNLGVPEEYLAKALSINVGTVRRRANMLNGVCVEARELLKDKNCPMTVFETLKKMKPLRQIEASELGSHVFHSGYIFQRSPRTDSHQGISETPFGQCKRRSLSGRQPPRISAGVSEHRGHGEHSANLALTSSTLSACPDPLMNTSGSATERTKRKLTVTEPGWQFQEALL